MNLVRLKEHDAVEIILKEDYTIPQKRQRIIDKFLELENEIPANKIQRLAFLGNIRNILETMPKSGNSVDAFVTKYAHRGSNEIAHMILVGSSSTLEHIIPQNREFDKDGHPISAETVNDPANVVVFCQSCNSQRGREFYDQWIKTRRNMKENFQFYTDKICCAIRDGILLNHNNYPQQMAKILAAETDDKIILDVSKYKEQLVYQ